MQIPRRNINVKFGIITLVSDNYGNKYQNYAVEHLLSKYGEVTTYALENLYSISQNEKQQGLLQKLKFSYISKVFRARMMYRYDYNATHKALIYSLIYVYKNKLNFLNLKKERSERFHKFSKKYLHIADVCLNYENSMKKEWIDGIDYFFCGSDQIWNPSYATTSRLAFCSFAPEKTIALAPSFGVSEIPQHRQAEYRNYLKSIYKLSVREGAGRDIIKKLSGRDAELLLDPTMALTVTEWEKIVRKPKIMLPERYVVCYFLGEIDKTYLKKIHDFAKKVNLSTVMLFDITNEDYYTFDPSEVLYTIKNADYVLTDSFHGTVFSILFHKNFYVFERNEGGASMNSRLETLLKIFDLQDRTNLYSTKNIENSKWNYVQEVLEKERVHTDKYLKSALNIVV